MTHYSAPTDCVHVGERASVEQLGLSSAALFGRGSEHRKGDAKVVNLFDQGYRRAYRGGSNDVMSAGVSEAGERVVFGADHQVQRPGAGTGGKRGVQSEIVRFDTESRIG